MENTNNRIEARKLFKAMRVASQTSSIEKASREIDAILASGQLPSAVIAEKQIQRPSSKLDVRTSDTDKAYVQAAAFNFLRRFKSRARSIPSDREDPGRDYYLADLWKEEPIMAGAVYSMTAKMTALKWAVTGRRLQARRAAEILATAAHIDGYDWGGFISPSVQDFYTLNRGTFWETPREGSALYGRLAGLGHIDAMACTLTGNKQRPMVYSSETTGQTLNFREGEYIHFTSMPSARERMLGMGFCAVDRALRALSLLMGLHDYDDEKLSNLPPEGVAAVTGLTMDELTDAFELWLAKRRSDQALTYPQVLWLLGSQPNVEVKVDFVGFSQLPESFDRDAVVNHYVNTLAMCFGVDAREFWPISSGALGTASESEIQHLKAKGKGPGELISTIERHINGELDAETQFGFDTQDIEEDMQAAVIAKAWVDAFYPLYTGTPAGKTKRSPNGKPDTSSVPSSEEVSEADAAGQAMGAAGPAGAPGGPEQVITKDELLRLLADKGVIPEWMLSDERYRVEDSQIHIRKDANPDDFTQIQYDRGVLKESRLPPIVIWAPIQNPSELLPDVTEPEPVMLKASNDDYRAVWQWMEHLKEEVLQRKIRGKPISSREVGRGAGVTATTVRDELKRWSEDPLLRQYLPDDEELGTLMASLEKQS